jgi:vacuole membrane protein 1
MDWNRLLKDNGVVTPQQISDFDHMRKDQRETLTLYQKPFTTLSKFFSGGIALVSFSCRYLLSHSLFLYGFVPAVVVWIFLDYNPGPYTETLNQIEFGIEFTVWWVGLGILSSIGLGSGLQSGVLFLFPHIIKVCLAAQTCKTLDFESASDMWFRTSPNLFRCPPLTPESTPVTLWGTWLKILLVCFLQSAGTAIGEIPPYWMTKAARLAAIEAGS